MSLSLQRILLFVCRRAEMQESEDDATDHGSAPQWTEFH